MMNENYNTQNQNPVALPRRPGGQPGNQNARVHGFYSRALTPKQREQLKLAEPVRGVDNEVAMLRVKIMTIIDEDPDNTAVLLRAVTALTRLLKVRALCAEDHEGSLAEGICNVYRDLAAPLGIPPEKFFSPEDIEESKRLLSASSLKRLPRTGHA